MDFADSNDVGGLIDVSSEDDCLFDSSPQQHHRSQENQKEDKCLESLEAVYADRSKDTANTFGRTEEPPQLSESMEPEIKKKVGKCNLRKSLAWDSAFFTSAGVLDPEELSSIIEGVKNSDKSSLPVIEEDLRQSTDSISTLESDSLTMEDIENNLFEDIRASIQKSSKAVNLVNSSGKSASVESKNQPISSKKAADFCSRNKINSKAGPKNTSCVIQGTGKTIKQSFSCPQATQPTAKSRESISSLSKPPKVLPRAQPTAKIRESISSLSKPPKVLARAQKVVPRANPISTVQTKRVSLGASYAKVDNENAKGVTGAVVNAAGRGAPVSKLPLLTNSRSTVPRPRFSSVSATKLESKTPSSSIDSSSSVSSDKTGISSISTSSQGKKNDSKSTNQPSAGSLPRTPSRIAVRHKTQSGNSNLSAYLKSIPKSSSSISPASSISEWSSVSSSSSTVNRPSSLKVSIDSISSGRGISLDNDATQAFQIISSDQFSDGHQNQGMGLARQTLKKTSVERDKLPCSASTKPSGLKLPSPKIGFFDGVKSPAGTPKREPQSHSGMQIGLSKMEAASSSPYGSSKAKSVKALNVTSPKTARNSRLKAESSRTEGPHTAKFVSEVGFEGELENQTRTGNVGRVCLEDIKITSIKTDFLSCESGYEPKVEGMKASKKVDDEISPKTVDESYHWSKMAAASSSPYGSSKSKSVKALNVTSPKTGRNSCLKAERSRTEGPHTAKFVSEVMGFEGELENQTRTGNVGRVCLEDIKITSIKTDFLSCESGYKPKVEGMKASKKVDDEISPKTVDESCHLSKMAAASSSPYGSSKSKSVKALKATSPKTGRNSFLKAERSRTEGPHTAKFVSEAKGFKGELENQTRTGNVGRVCLEDIKITSIKTNVLSCESGYESKVEGMKATKKVDDEISPKAAYESCLKSPGSSCIEGPDLSVEEKGLDGGYKSRTITGNVGYDHLEGIQTTHIEVSGPYCALISPFVEDIKPSKDGLENNLQFLGKTNEKEKANASNQIESKLLVGAVDHSIELMKGTDDGFSSEPDDNCLNYSRNAGSCQIFSEVHKDLSRSGDKTHLMIQSSDFEGLDAAKLVSDPGLDGEGKGCEEPFWTAERIFGVPMYEGRHSLLIESSV